MPRPTAPFSLLCVLSLGLAAAATPAGAADSGPFANPFADPFATEAALAASPCQRPLPDGALGLAEIVDLALCNNPQTREAWASARVQAGLAGTAQAAYLPSLNATAGSSRVRTRVEDQDATRKTVNSASLSFSWLLYDFGARAANLENARQLLAAALASEDSTRQAVFLAALQAFFQTHALQAAVDAATLSEKAARESLAAADARYRAGSATPADRLQAQTALSQATLARIRVGGDLNNARGALANAIGIDAQRPLQLAPWAAEAPSAAQLPDFEAQVEALIGDARRQRPDLAAAEAQLQAARAGVDASRAAHLPTVSLLATPAWQSSSGLTTNSSSVGLSVSVPLFSGFGQTYKLRTAEAQAELRAAQRDRLQLQVALDVWRAYQNLTTATQSLRTTADLLASAEQSERVALGRYRAGLGSILDVLTAQSALAQARQQRVQAAYDWNVSRATLAQAAGVLDAAILPAFTATAGEFEFTRPKLPAASAQP